MGFKILTPKVRILTWGQKASILATPNPAEAGAGLKPATKTELLIS